MNSLMEIMIFQDPMPCCPAEFIRRFGIVSVFVAEEQHNGRKLAAIETLLANLRGLFFSPEDIKMCYSERSVNLYRTIRRYI
jgi:hypothetical protein